MPEKKLFLLILLATCSCVTQFIPETRNVNNFPVVEGLLTDQNNSYKIKISSSSQLDTKSFNNSPITGCVVSVSDDAGNNYLFQETQAGLYSSDSTKFRGEVGREYILHITSGNHFYESRPVKMQPVPPIDSVYAEIVYNNNYSLGQTVPGYQIYVDTHDPEKKCNFYRWDFTETWEFKLPYFYETIINRICWKTANSNKIFVKNTSVLAEDRVSKLALNFVTTETDRLQVKYSFFVRQYSLNQEEYTYWDALQRITENVGGLYDIVPMSVESNINCIDNPAEKVLGFFSVSSVASKRIFIKNTLTGFQDFYINCPTDTISSLQSDGFLNIYNWVIAEYFVGPGQSRYVLTDKKECTDCSLTGSNIMPPYWNDTKDVKVIQSDLK